MCLCSSIGGEIRLRIFLALNEGHLIVDKKVTQPQWGLSLLLGLRVGGIRCSSLSLDSR